MADRVKIPRLLQALPLRRGFRVARLALAVFFGLSGSVWVGGQGLARDGGAVAAGSVGSDSTSSDFNGDGFSDLATGTPFEDVGLVTDAGGVNVLYGSGDGLQATVPADQFWTQDSPDVEDEAEGQDGFGWALATGDFNGDGFDDLAVGAPKEDLGPAVWAGAVHVLYGSLGGLQVAFPEDQLWTQDSTDVEDDVEGSDRFGRALATSDFNGDGFSDLAVGETFEHVDIADDAGAVNVLYGSAGGLQATVPADQFWNQDTTDVEDRVEAEDRFGWSLTTGDFNGDGFGDLAIGSPFEGLPGVRKAGAANVLYGSAEGLQVIFPEDQLWTQDSPGVDGSAQSTDRLGWFLGSGDYNGDGFDDLAMGVPFEDLPAAPSAGVVNVLYGSAAGLQATSPKDQLVAQDGLDVEDVAETHDWYGWSLASADFGGDGFDDLAVGIRLENVEAILNAGAVNVLYGTAGGLQAISPDDQLWTQDSPDVENLAEEGDEFGWSLVARDFNADGFADLAVGVLLENVGKTDAGAVNLLYGSAGGLQATSPEDQLWTQDSPDVEDVVEQGDQFGFTFSVGAQCVPPCHSQPILEGAGRGTR
jgi:hypothetical protein